MRRPTHRDHDPHRQGIGHDLQRLPTTRVVLLGALLLNLWHCAPQPEPPPRGLAGAAAGWNVVLLSIDTLRADRLGSNGYTARATSPRMDALQGSGVRFARAMAPRALTWPSLASVLTGLYPGGHRVVQNGYSLPEGLATLPTLLKDAGYETGAFLSNMCRANHQGWDAFSCGGGVDGKVTRRALEWIEDQGGTRPFFLWAHYFGPHPPYYNGGETARQVFDPDYRGSLAPTKGRLDPIMKQGIELNAADQFHLDALYDAAVLGTDHTVNGLLASLEKAGKLEKTLLIFLADHGEELYQHNRYLYHACSVYQTALHVPLALSAPGLLPSGVSVSQTVELIDVLPTALELLGLEAPTDLHGESLVPYLERAERGGFGKPAYSEYGDTRIRTVLFDNWKLIHNPDRITPACLPGAPPDFYPIAEVELYDLRQDPGEIDNLASAHPQKVATLKDLLRSRFSAMSTDVGIQEVPDDLKKELEALGYVAQ